MKKCLLGLVLVSSLAHAQKKQEAKDSLKQKPLIQATDTTALLNWKDYQDFVDQVGIDLPARYADPVRNWWVDRLRKKATIYNKKMAGE